MALIELELHTEESLRNPDSGSVLKDKRLLNPRLFNIPPFKEVAESTEAYYIKKLCRQGFLRRYSQPNRAAEERLEYELKIFDEIEGMYRFLILMLKTTEIAHTKGFIIAPGWSGSPGSLALYCLNINDVDPLKYDLIFETFIRPVKENSIAVPCLFMTVPENIMDIIQKHYLDNFEEISDPDQETKRSFSLNILAHKKATVIKEILEQQLKKKITIESEKIPLDEEEAFQLILKEEREGIFKNLSDKDFENIHEITISGLAAFIALQDNKEKVAVYVKGKTNPGAGTNIHPIIKNRLKETCGIPVYREQIISIIAEFSRWDNNKSAIFWRTILSRRKDLKKYWKKNSKRSVSVTGLIQKQ